MQTSETTLTGTLQVTKVKATKECSSYRGFSSIDQEIEREIALKWFTSSDKKVVSQRNFLLKER
jgi:hypothetical protein